jgi:hypothetical protein
MLYTSIVSFASRTAHGVHAPNGPRAQQGDTAVRVKEAREKETLEIVRALIAVRAKLKRSLILKTNIGYEVSSFVLL